jgi:actin-like ATPase involved in cell morphogenesis
MPLNLRAEITPETIKNIVIDNTAVLTEPPSLPTDRYTDGTILTADGGWMGR